MERTLEDTFERCCRLCAEEQEVTIMIFSAEAEAMFLQNKLNKYLLIEVDENDKLPKNICLKCCSKLQTVSEFIDTARKAQEVLLNRSIMLDQMTTNNCLTVTNVKSEVKTEPYSNDDAKITEMEISVDPMMVLQNSEGPLSPSPNENSESNPEDIIYLHGVDGENVTIKLIKKGEKHRDYLDDKRDMKPFPCSTCKRGFFSELALKNHSWTHVQEDKPNNIYRCSTCDAGFDEKSDLISHLKEHKSIGKCELCGRGFRTEKNLAAHMEVHLSMSKAYTCKVCLRSYNTMSNLKTHSITHSNERPYKCTFCYKSFKRNQDLKFHTNQHTGAKPYKCPFCDKSFASSGNCYSHRSRMHPGRHTEANVKRRSTASREFQVLKPRAIAPKTATTSVKGIFKYQCQQCDHSFIRRDNFTYHMYQHTGEKPFQCSFCSEEFVTRKGLLLHHDKKHPAKDRPLALISKNALLK